MTKTLWRHGDPGTHGDIRVRRRSGGWSGVRCAVAVELVRAGRVGAVGPCRFVVGEVGWPRRCEGIGTSAALIKARLKRRSEKAF